MARHLAKIGVLLLSASFGCVYYGLDVEGKTCTSLRPCPPGYRCEKSIGADGGMVCKPGSVDGGNGNCTEGESQCADFTTLAVCRSGDWRLEECDSGKYCFDADGDLTAACVSECTESPDCTALIANYYCNPSSLRCEEKGDCNPPDEDKCSLDSKQVLYCDPESGIDLVKDTCEDNEYCHRSPPPVMCLPYCDDDLGCRLSEGTSCNLSSRRCVDLNLCQIDADCPVPETGTSVCVGAPVGSPGACVIEPTEQSTIPGGANPDLTCYAETVTISDGPSTCALEGRVVMFFTRVPVPADECPANLIVQLHNLDDILNGIGNRPEVVGQLTRVGTDDNEWQYRMESVSTNRPFVMEVRCDSPQGPVEEYRTLYTFEVYIRAEDCLGPDFTCSFGAPVLYTANYDSYSGIPGITMDPEMGLVFGWLKDCQGDKLLAGTGGLSMAQDILFYLPSSGPPDLAATHTSAPGFFAAANVLPVRGIASALVKHLGSPLSLRSREFRVFPSKGSLVIFDRPKKPL